MLLLQAGDLAPETKTSLWAVLMWVLLLVVAFVTMLLLAMWFRRQFMGGSRRRAAEPAGFSIAELRAMREAGEMSQEEYEMTRDRLVQAAHRKIAHSAGADRVRPDAPQTKDVDLIREAER